MPPKKTSRDTTEDYWQEIIGRSLAYLCLQSSDARDKGLHEKAEFLEQLGLTRSDCAELLGTTTDSLKVLRGRAKKKRAKRKAS